MKLKSLFISAAVMAATLCTQAQNASFNVATYNLRQQNGNDDAAGNGWEQRAPIVAQLIQFHDFDIFGTQEGFKHQLDDLQKALPGYSYIGVGRDDGHDAGEHSAIFYRDDLFDLLDHGDFWLSETPEKPGLGWDAVCVRICTWGKFRHRASGKEFVYMNLHMDHVGKVARVESAKLVRSRIKDIVGDGAAIVTGDFNVDQTHESYRTMTANNELVDSYETAELRYAPNGTFNGYHTDGFTNSRIDHVFVTPDIKVRKYGVLTDTYRTPDGPGQDVKLNAAPREIRAKKYTARTPSDHFPVMVQLEL